MGSAAALLLVLGLQIGPDGWQVGGVLAGSELAPVRALAPVAAGLWLVHHEVDAAPMAFYLPAQPLPPTVTLWAGADGDEGVDLPRLALPRLVLYAPYYRPPPPLRDLAVDTAEYLLRALLEARLDPERRPSDDPYLQVARRRAEALVVDLPPADRLPAYLAAAADFGAHVVGVANELGRAARRRAAAGRAPCPRSDGTLFARWPGIFAGGQFRPHVGGEGSAARWSVHALERQDQELLLREVLDAAWSGDLAVDLPGLCSGAAPEEAR